MRSPIRTEIQETLRLTIPLASAQVAQAATGFVDTVMMGWLGQETLAAGGLATTTFSTLLIVATGIVFGISPLIAEAYGAGNKSRIQRLTRQGFWLSLLVALPVMLLLGHMNYFMLRLGQTASLVSLADKYLKVMVWGFFPALTFAMLKSVVSSLSQPKLITIVVVAATIFNAIGNYVLGFGKLGFPALGLAGIALASTLSYWMMLLSLIVYIFKSKQFRVYQFGNLFQFEPKIIRELIEIGFPIAVSFAFEVGLFSTTTYLMGTLGTQVLAAHQIVLQTIIVIFMVPLGISLATTIRVGQWNGQQDITGVRRAANVGMCLGATFMSIMAIALLLFPRQIIGLYIDIHNAENARVVSLATSMLSVAALSQILDGVQTTAAGALRGLKDTRIPMLLSFLAFWGIGLTTGYLLGFHLGFGGVGLWVGQLIGVAVSAVFFIWRLQRLMLQE